MLNPHVEQITAAIELRSQARRSLYAAQQMQISLQLAEQQNRITLWKVLGGQALPAE